MSGCEIGIVGGSGFVGSSLAKYLSDSFNVKVVDTRTIPEDLKDRVDFQQCDIRNYNEVRQKIRDVDAIIFAAVVQIPLINLQKRKGYEVNVLGVQNVCEIVCKERSMRGFILTGSWHVLGDKGFQGDKDEDFGFKPDTIEDRAKYYTLTKIAQETIVRIYDEMSDKVFGTVRMGTVLGNGMPEKTAANIFITQAIKGEAITPYRQSMHRPMFFVDINDVCEGFKSYVNKILNGEVERNGDSLAHIVNLAYPKSVTILELATIVRDAVIKKSGGEIQPEIKIVDEGLGCVPNVGCRKPVMGDAHNAKGLLGLKKVTSPEESIEGIVGERMSHIHE